MPDYAKRRKQVSDQRWKAALAEHAPCWNCKGPVLRREKEALGRYGERMTCQNPECRTAYRRYLWKLLADEHKERIAELGKEEAERQWANARIREGEPVDWQGGFAAHNLPPEPSYGRLPLPPVARTQGGVSAGWAVRGGE